MQKLVFDSDLVHTVSQYSHLKTPFMITDLDIVIRNCKEFKNKIPGVRLYYAVKALSSKEIIQTMRDYVDGFDVASVTEIDALITYGVKPDKLNFSNPVKSSDSIEYAFARGISHFTFQSLPELHKIKEHAPGSSVYVRVKTNDSQSLVPLSEKFGCLRPEAVDLLKKAQELGLKPVGVTFHIGSQLLDNSIWTEAIKAANEIVDEAQEAGLETNRINIGGGFSARYFESDSILDTAAHYIEKAIQADSSVEYIAEPGRYIIASSSLIVSKIIGIETRNGKSWVFIDTGLFQSFLGASRYNVFPYGPITLNTAKSPEYKSKMASYVLTGPTCDSYDVIATEVELPDDIKVDDLLIFPNTGAYTVVYGSAFNGFTVPDRYYLKGGELL